MTNDNLELDNIENGQTDEVSRGQITQMTTIRTQISETKSSRSVESITTSEFSLEQSNHHEQVTMKIHPDEEIKKAESTEIQGQTKESEKMVRIKKKVGLMVIISFILITFGLTAAILWPSLYHDILVKEFVLSENSTSYGFWKQTPVPMFLKIYMFNWTNHNQIGVKNVKPHFEQMGPYVFKEVDTKVNKVWNANGTITFQQKRVWHFVPSLSNGSMTDKVTNLNPVAASIVYIGRREGYLMQKLVNQLLEVVESIVVTKSIQEILFDGYDDKLLRLAVKMNFTDIPYDKFAWFYQRNGSETYDGIFNILTGANNIYDVGEIQEWKYNKVSPYFSKSCGNIRGSLGDLWPPLPDNGTVQVFSPDVCSSLTLKSVGTSNWLGLSGTKYVSNEDMFDNGTRVESRKCYCEGVECQPSGAMNISACKFGAPAFVSLPHFYLADESYRQNISGMNPNAEDHRFEITVQPITGTPMQVRGALQINFMVHPDESLSYFRDLPHMYVPMLWFVQEVNLTSEYASQLKMLVIIHPALSGVLYSIAAIGILLVALSIYLYVRQRLEDEQTERLVPNDNGEKDTGVVASEEE